MRFPFLIVPVLVCGSCAAFGQAASPASAADPLQQGIAALRQNHSADALADFQQALRANPNSEAANLYAATAAMELYHGSEAVQYAERARQLDPKDWRVHTTLVAAYAAAGDKQRRDAERSYLASLHKQPGDGDAQKTSGFLLEMFPAGRYRVSAIQYFKPVGKFHVYYRFLIDDAAGRRVWEIDAESNDFDEKSWADAHPQLAAQGDRQYQLTGQGGGEQQDYAMFSGKPDYDAIKALVLKAIAERTPFPTEKKP
jgi:tetratricopeptide (TPR) repeat protein